MKKQLLVLILLLLALLLLGNPTWAIDEIKIILDGQELETDVPPMMEQGRTLLPMRVIFEALGCEVQWSEKIQFIMAYNCMPQPSIRVNLIVGQPFSCTRFIENELIWEESLGLDPDILNIRFSWELDEYFAAVKNSIRDQYPFGLADCTSQEISTVLAPFRIDYLNIPYEDMLQLAANQEFAASWPEAFEENRKNLIRAFSWIFEEKPSIDPLAPIIKLRKLDVPPQIVQGRTLVPLRFVAETLGCQVDWNDISKTVTIIRTDSQ